MHRISLVSLVIAAPVVAAPLKDKPAIAIAPANVQQVREIGTIARDVSSICVASAIRLHRVNAVARGD